ncbi:MAG TPA: TlpA disulfide reductase family protein [Candidatus Sulfotelmatobacter sp.]|nr:TlpA disulfide reductase family protein [Candidatus Sulfotelmatobacter sp.]
MSQGMSRSRLPGQRSRAMPAGLGVMAAALAIGGAAIAGTPASNVAHELGADPTTVQRVLENHALQTLDGRRVTLSSLQGQVVVVNFWASWCAPCRHELPALDALNSELSKKGGHVVAVSIDEDRANAARFARAQKLGLTVVHDGPDGLAKQLDLSHVPFTIVLDRDGTIAYAGSGSNDAAIQRVTEVARQLSSRAPLTAQQNDGGSR